MTRIVWGYAVRAAGWVLLVAGIILFILPIPLGIPVLAVALVLLVSTSRTARRIIRWARMRSGPVDRALSLVETRVPAGVRAILRKTRVRRIGRRRPAV